MIKLFISDFKIRRQNLQRNKTKKSENSKNGKKKVLPIFITLITSLDKRVINSPYPT